jgi:hypothetical protein
MLGVTSVMPLYHFFGLFVKKGRMKESGSNSMLMGCIICSQQHLLGWLAQIGL